MVAWPPLPKPWVNSSPGNLTRIAVPLIPPETRPDKVNEAVCKTNVSPN